MLLKMNKLVLFIVHLQLALRFTSVQGGYTVEPQNVAILSGNPVTLSCVSDSSSTVDWRFQPPSGSLVTIVNDCQLNPAYEGQYRLVNVGQGQCDIEVINAISARAGTYFCEAGFDPAVSSQLIVIASDPSCGVSPSTGPIYEGMNLTYTCSVSYSPDLIRMSMTWTNAQGQEVQAWMDHDDGVTTSRLIVTATLPSLGVYRCVSQFSQPSGLPSTATNIPVYTHQWSSPAFTVTPKPDPIAPLNTAARVGQSVTLQCRRTTQKIAWTFVPAGSGSSTIIVVDCVPIAVVSDLYSVNSVDGSCHLIINNVTTQLSGTYTCQDTAANDRVVSAELISIVSDPVCSQSSLGPSIPAGTQVQFTCTFHYTGAITPRMDWTASGGSVPATSERVNTTFLESVVSVSASNPLLPSHTCITQFNPPDGAPPSHIDPATNTPNYQHSWTSTEVPVEGSPSGSDCGEILANNPGAPDGVYTLVLTGGREVEVWCDMTTNGGGWTVIQRRMDGSQNFYRQWNEYAAGFGNVEGEYWLGNDNIAALTASGTYRLRIDLGDFSNNVRYAHYTDFTVGASSTQYTLQSLGTYSGDAGDAMEYLAGHAFSTHDDDNDSDSERNCAQGYRGAWWYNACSYSNLNGEYNNTNSYQGVVWFHWTGDTYSLRYADMKIRK